MIADWIDDLEAKLARVAERSRQRDRDAAHVYATWQAGGVCIEPDCPYHPTRQEDAWPTI